MTYFIAIPSYKRYNICNQQTLNTLHKLGIPKDKINVFVVEEEYDTYLGTLNHEYYNKIIVGKKGLIQQRAFIETYYPLEANIVSLDDDIKSIDLSLTEFLNLDSFFTKAFEDLKLHKAFIWGVYPVFNSFFRESKTFLTTELKYIVGAFYGFINRQNMLPLSLENDNKEDVERSIKYFLYDGIVLRYNKVGFETKYYGKDGGGMGKFEDRIQSMKTSALQLHSQYPTLCDVKIRKNGMYELVLKKRPPVCRDENGVVILPKISPDDINVIYDLLESVNIPYKRGRNNRRGFPIHRAVSYGYIRNRYTGQFGLSAASLKNPEIYKELVNLGQRICPFRFISIHVNRNVVCPPHLDSKNQGKSLLISFGEYNGCKLVVNGKEYDTNCQPIIFDGSSLEHLNTPLESGTKYSIVFFNGELSNSVVY
jgi:hypothetical protein